MQKPLHLSHRRTSDVNIGTNPRNCNKSAWPLPQTQQPVCVFVIIAAGASRKLLKMELDVGTAQLFFPWYQHKFCARDSTFGMENEYRNPQKNLKLTYSNFSTVFSLSLPTMRLVYNEWAVECQMVLFSLAGASWRYLSLLSLVGFPECRSLDSGVFTTLAKGSFYVIILC